MSGLELAFDLVLHLDVHLANFAAAYGAWIYVALFLIVFAETGLVITPFLPGDSLLFAAGALAAIGAIDLLSLVALLVVAAIFGDAVNYAAGLAIGPRIFRWDANIGFWNRVLNRSHLERSRAFFDRYGGKAIVLGRFAPIVRTFVPFVAGAVAMTYSRFAFFNVSGAFLWVGVCVAAGYGFGNVPVVKENFSLVVLGIVLVSMLPALLGSRLERRSPSGP